MRWLLVLALAAVAGLLGWLVVAERERAVRERQGLTETEAHRVLAPGGAAAEAEPAPEAEQQKTAVLRGTVSGRYGGIWGVHVVALGAGADDVLAETETDPEGHYTLELPAGAVVDLVVEPAQETNLKTQRRDATAVPAVVDVTYERQAEATGRLRCVDSRHVRRLELIAVREEEYEQGQHPAEMHVAGTASVETRPDGAPFVFEGLAPGVYRLAAKSDAWMLQDPIRFAADTRGIEAAAVRAFGVRLEVKDAVSGSPIARFRVEIRFNDVTALTWEGRDGGLRRRVPHPMPGDWVQSGMALEYAEVTAPGYFVKRVAFGYSGTVELRQPRDPNVLLKVRYDDGTGCVEPLRVVATREDTPAPIEFARALDGGWWASLPPGAWTLCVSRVGPLMPKQRISLDVLAKGTPVCELTVPRAGTLILHSKGRQAIEIAGGGDAAAAVGRLILLIADGRQEYRLQPGRYRLFAPVSAAGSFAEIDVGPGDRIDVDLPRKAR